MDHEDCFTNGEEVEEHGELYIEGDADGYVDEHGNVDLKNSIQSETVILQDEPNFKVYQTCNLLEDGREVITTTTLTTNEAGETTEEVVTEIIESEEVGSDQAEDDAHSIGQEEMSSEPFDVEVNQAKLAERAYNEANTAAEGSAANPQDNDVPSDSEEQGPTKAAEDYGLGLEEASRDKSTAPEKKHISYEEFESQFTEYKPPKRYEKKSSDKASDKGAPKISIMSSDDSEGLQSEFNHTPAAYHEVNSMKVPENSGAGDSVSVSADLRGGERTKTSTNSSESRAPTMSQPTRTQGSIIRRMDSDNRTIDPDSIVKADTAVNIEAELPAQGTSRNLRMKFQATTPVPPTPALSSQQSVNKEKLVSSQPRNAVENGILVNGLPTLTHKEPDFEGGEIENIPEVRNDVIRESDRKDEEELPETGLAKNLLSRFKSLESESAVVKKQEHRPSGIASKPTVTPLRPKAAAPVVNSENDSEVFAEPERAEYESQPIVREDVVKEADRNDEVELPTSGITRNLVSTFREREKEAKSTPAYKPSGAGNRKSAFEFDPPSVRPSSQISVEPRDEPRFEGGEVENKPVVRDDVVREADTNHSGELPEPGLAKNLKARYQQFQRETSQNVYVEHIPSGVASKATPTPLGSRPQGTSPTTRSLSGSRISVTDEDTVDLSRPQVEVEGGEFENVPERRTDVVREEDRMDEVELPEAGLAKNLLSKFKTLETESEQLKKVQYTPSGVGTKATPSKLNIMAGRSAYHKAGLSAELPSTADLVYEEPLPEAGEFENQPVARTDVVKADASYDEEELPEQGVTKNLMSRFKSIEEQQKCTVQHRPSGVGNKPTPTPLRPASLVMSSSAGAGDTEEASQRQDFENEPTVNPNVVRSGDPVEHDHLPSPGAAKSAMARLRLHH